VKQVFFTLYVAAIIKSHALSPGTWPDTTQEAVESMTYLIIVEVSYNISMLFLKLSLGLFFLRLVIDRRQRLAIKLLMVVSTITNFAISFWDIGVCGNPAHFYFNIFMGKCPSLSTEEAVAFMQATVNMMTDLMLLAIPFLLLRGSQMPRRVKAYVTAILFLAMA
jgi:hypothetical protein